MNDDLKKYTQVDRLVGEEIDQETVESLITEGRIKFPFKPTTQSAISQPADQKDPQLEDDLDELINSVKENEDTVKLLEDMRDDMLNNMSIPPMNSQIADAAKRLGSPNGEITKEIFDRAEAILDPVPLPPGLTFSAPHAALTGFGTVEGQFLNCNEVSKGMMDAWNLSADKEGDLTADEIHKQGNAVDSAKQSFAKKMGSMIDYMFAMLWWEKIWSRLVIFVIESTEKLVARTIDSIVLIFKWKKLTKENFYLHGPVHKILNRLKIHLLCVVPKRAWKDYSPDPKIKVYKKAAKSIKLMPLTEFCKQKGSKDCPETQDSASSANLDDVKDINKKFDSVYPDEDNSDCVPGFGDLFNETDPEGPGMSPRCMEAAKQVMDAVYDDAKYFGEYDGSADDAAESLKSIIEGDIAAARKANK